MQQSPIGAARWGGAPFRPLLHGDRLRAIIMLPVSLHTRSKNYGALLGPKQRFYRVLRNRWWNRSCSRVPQNRERTRTFYLKQHSTFPRPRKVGALMCQQGKGEMCGGWMGLPVCGTEQVPTQACTHCMSCLQTRQYTALLNALRTWGCLIVQLAWALALPAFRMRAAPSLAGLRKAWLQHLHGTHQQQQQVCNAS